LLARYTNNAKYPNATCVIAAAGSVINITIKGGNALLPSNGVQASTAAGDLHRSYIKLDGATHVTFAGTATAGLYDYTVQNGMHIAATAPDSGLTPADAANWYLARFGLSATADAIINTTAMLGRDWHYALDSLYLRMGDFRADWSPAPVGRDLASRRGHPGAFALPLANRDVTQGRALQIHPPPPPETSGPAPAPTASTPVPPSPTAPSPNTPMA
jgi:hypothetical protein